MLNETIKISLGSNRPRAKRKDKQTTVVVNLVKVPMLGTAMPMRERTTCVIPDWAAFAESPKRFPASSVTGIPT